MKDFTLIALFKNVDVVQLGNISILLFVDVVPVDRFVEV
jgi:hypothetical protein